MTWAEGFWSDGLGSGRSNALRGLLEGSCPADDASGAVASDAA
jgi:hypothetical protein